MLTGPVGYLIPHSMCLLIHVGSMETIKEQTNTIEGESPEELTLDEQQLGLALGLTASRVLPPGLLAVSEQGPAPGCSP